MRDNRLTKFIGREREIQYLQEVASSSKAVIIVVHGRRRVGKTTLIQRSYGNRNLIKIEGIEGGTTKEQLYSAVQQLAPYFPGEPITSWSPKTWGDFFRLVAPLLKDGKWTLFLEEYQWLSSYRTALTAELKLAWDNQLSKNSELILVLCGSSPSFMVGKVLRSKALHNRSQHELRVDPLPFSDARKLLPRGCDLREAFDAYLLVGGIPEYLNRLNNKSSIFLSFVEQAFTSNGFFVDEYNRILVSSLAENPNYKKILKYLSKVRFATRAEIASTIKTKPGGSLSNLLLDLAASGFVRAYHPIDKTSESLLERYMIADPFLRTYEKHIAPKFSRIRDGEFNKDASSAITIERLYAHLGYAFEQYCRNNARDIAKLLGFSGIQFTAGAYFSRAVEEKMHGFQIDLVFQRADRVHTICEIKYTNAPVSVDIIEPFERRVAAYRSEFVCSIHRVLISAAGADRSILDRPVFDEIIDLKRLVGHP